jgi:hypothetical protein
MVFMAESKVSTRSNVTRERHKVLAENVKILRFIYRPQRKSLKGKGLENVFSAKEKLPFLLKKSSQRHSATAKSWDRTSSLCASVSP